MEAENIHLFIKAIAVDPPPSPKQFPESTGTIVFSRSGSHEFSSDLNGIRQYQLA